VEMGASRTRDAALEPTAIANEAIEAATHMRPPQVRRRAIGFRLDTGPVLRRESGEGAIDEVD
jgi:hypothetical protein